MKAEIRMLGLTWKSVSRTSCHLKRFTGCGRRTRALSISVPVFEEQNKERERIEVKHVSIEDRFKKFYEKQTGGAVPDEEMVRLFLELASGVEEEDAK
nr:hypothetical protein P5668_01455 [Bacillus subtilis]